MLLLRCLSAKSILTIDQLQSECNEPFWITFEEKVYHMVNPKTTTSILNNLRSYQNKLSILAGYSREDFLQDFTKVESAKHLLQVSIECCLDIAHHIVADEGYRTPQDSYDTFIILYEQGILPDRFCCTMS